MDTSSDLYCTVLMVVVCVSIVAMMIEVLYIEHLCRKSDKKRREKENDKDRER